MGSCGFGFSWWTGCGSSSIWYVFWMNFALGVWVCRFTYFGLVWLNFVVALLLGFVVGLCFCFSLVWWFELVVIAVDLVGVFRVS